MRALSLCSGVGGLDLAVEALTGAKTAFCADNDPVAAAVLAARFPDAMNLGDITAVDWAAFAAEHPGIDIITAGFPCQDISNAGRRAGISGERSGIWSSVADAIRHIRPRLVFLENVAAIRSRGLGVVLADLAEVGYDARWLCLRASDVGAPHQRDRWFCVAFPADTQGVGRAERRAEPEEQPRRLRRPAGGGSEPAADANGGGRNRRAGDEPEPQGWNEPADPRHSPARWWGVYLPAIRRWEHVTGAPAPEPTEIGPRGGRRLAAPFAEWLMGWPAGWVTAVPGLTRAQQLHKIGNGVVPQQAMEAYRRLLEGAS